MKITATNKPLGVRVRVKDKQYNTNQGEAYDGTGEGPFDEHRLEAGQSLEIEDWLWMEVVEYEAS